MSFRGAGNRYISVYYGIAYECSDYSRCCDGPHENILRDQVQDRMYQCRAKPAS